MAKTDSLRAIMVAFPFRTECGLRALISVEPDGTFGYAALPPHSSSDFSSTLRASVKLFGDELRAAIRAGALD